MKQMTTYECLYQFVQRADTEERVKIAEEWLKKNTHLTSRAFLEDLLRILENKSKALFRQRLENDKRVIAILAGKKLYYTNKETGEVMLIS